MAFDCNAAVVSSIPRWNGLLFINILIIEASRGAGTQSVTVNATGYGFDYPSSK